MQNLKNKRLEAHLTQAVLAHILSVSQVTVACWENGTKFPTADKLPAIAKALDCTIDELFSHEEKEAG